MSNKAITTVHLYPPCGDTIVCNDVSNVDTLNEAPALRFTDKQGRHITALLPYLIFSEPAPKETP